MTDEHPAARGTGQHSAGDENQDLYAERTMAEAPETSDARVDDAVAGLSRLRGRPAEEHVAILEEVHGQLRDILDDLGPGHAPAGGSVRGVQGDEVPPGKGIAVPPGQP
jgi:hypothetical protein